MPQSSDFRFTSSGKMREEKANAAVVRFKSNNKDNRIKSKRNHEEYNKERMFNRTETTFFTARLCSKSNEASGGNSELTWSYDNQPVALVFRGGIIIKLIENSGQSNRKVRSCGWLSARIEFILFDDCFDATQFEAQPETTGGTGTSRYMYCYLYNSVCEFESLQALSRMRERNWDIAMIKVKGVNYFMIPGVPEMRELEAPRRATTSTYFESGTLNCTSQMLASVPPSMEQKLSGQPSGAPK